MIDGETHEEFTGPMTSSDAPGPEARPTPCGDVETGEAFEGSRVRTEDTTNAAPAPKAGQTDGNEATHALHAQPAPAEGLDPAATAEPQTSNGAPAKALGEPAPADATPPAPAPVQTTEEAATAEAAANATPVEPARTEATDEDAPTVRTETTDGGALDEVKDDAQPPDATEQATAPEPEPTPPPRPSISSFEPDHGPLSGGMVAVTGEGFVEGCVVIVGGVEAATVFQGPNLLRVDVPGRATAGVVPANVVNPDGQSDGWLPGFRYNEPPSITGTEPVCVSAKGGAVITILGVNFGEGCTATIGGEAVPTARVNAHRVEAVAKARAAGEHDLEVTNSDGQRATRERAIRFAEPPEVVEVAPQQVTLAGGISVRVSGRGFEPGLTVILGDEPVATVAFEDDTALAFVAPARGKVGRVDLAVVNSTGLTHKVFGAFTYVKAPPLVVAVEPASGPSSGGTPLAVRGQDFDEGCAVFLSGMAASVTFKGPFELEVLTPAAARDGLADVRVVNSDNQAHTVEKAFRYQAALRPPVLNQVSPGQGPQSGGLKVAMLGDDFTEGVVVRFGGVPATVRFLSRKELEVLVPAGAAPGAVPVEVVNPDGAVALVEGAFVYESRPAPTVTGIQPTFGPTTGGTRVVLEGSNFTRDTQVFVGRESPKDLVVKSATEIQIVTAPRKASGVVDVEVAVPSLPKAIMKNGFRYDAAAPPMITSVAPNAGRVDGGDDMSITGKSFTKETVVLVDGKAPKTVKFVNATTLEFKVPPGTAGKMVDILVRNADGKEAVQKRAFLYDPRYR